MHSNLNDDLKDKLKGVLKDVKLLEGVYCSEKGQGMVEYGLILALVSAVAISAIGGVGEKVSNTFRLVDDEMHQGDYTSQQIDKMVRDGYVPIASAEELNQLRDNNEQAFGKGTIWESTYTSGLDKQYIQVLDIDLAGIGNWEPIGSEVNQFMGIFNGGGYTIRNLVIDRSFEDGVGLFGRTRGSAIENVHLIDVIVGGNASVGGLVGISSESSTIQNSSVSGSVKGDRIVGGLVGYGWTESSLINSYATGTVSGKINVGGLVGVSSRSSKIIRSYSNSFVKGEEGYVGGIVGQNWVSSVIEDSYFLGQATGHNERVGGIVGQNEAGSFVKRSGWCLNGSIKGIGINGGSVDNGTKGYQTVEILEKIKNLFK